MSFLANDMFQTSGPTTLLARKATVVGVTVPSWPLLSQAEGRRQLTTRLCGALRRDSGEAIWQAVNEPADQPDDVFLARLVGQVAVDLQNLAGHPVSRTAALPRGEAKNCRAAWEYLLARTGQVAGKVAAELIALAAGPAGLADDEVAFEKVSEYVAEVSSAVGNSVVEVLLEAACRRGLPWQMIDPAWPMIAFGQGSAMKRLMTTITETQGHISTLFTSDKMLSLQVLREAGFPVPSHELVRSEDDAVTVAEKLGYPVVVKPTDLMRSRGVSINLQGPQEVREAYKKARALSSTILVETHLQGLSYRILVIGGRAVAAMERCVPTVIGDGTSNVRDLIDKTNRERAELALRTASATRRINVNKFEAELPVSLAAQGLDLDAVPAAAQRVRLTFMSETGWGGENLDVTDLIHPDTLAMAEDMAQLLETPVLGIDFMTDDIARSCKQGKCGINEVNSEPALSLHQRSTYAPRDVVTPYLDKEFGRDGNGCIPIVCSLGGDARTFGVLQDALAALGLRHGLAMGDDLAVIGRYRLPATAANPRPAGRILADSRTDCALVQLAKGDFDNGLAFDSCTAVYLPQPLESTAPAGGFSLAQAVLLIDEIAETVILPLEDHDFWSQQVELSHRRVLLLAQGTATDAASVAAALRNGAEIVDLRSGAQIDILHHHGDHLDRLLVLDSASDGPDSRDIDALLLAVAGLLALDRHPRDITAAATSAWRSTGPGR